jgi:tetratricopeptide (TPR) repeat protein
LKALNLLRILAAAGVALTSLCPAARAAEPPMPPSEAPVAGPPTPTSPDAPAPPTDAEVERHATLGQRLLARGRAQEAIAEFRRGYELRADPRFLFDIAEGYRQLGRSDQALFFYQRYLKAAPEGPDREDAEEQIAELEKTATPPPAAKPPAPSLAHDVVIVPVEGRPEEARPLWRRWWAWTAVGVLIVGGAVTAFALGRDRTSVPATALGDQKFY